MTIYNYLINKGKQITISPVEKMHVLGTPDDMNFFINNAITKFGEKIIGLCCDQTGADGTAGTADDIDCASLAGNGSCDEECNSGACNNDGGDCE